MRYSIYFLFLILVKISFNISAQNEITAYQKPDTIINGVKYSITWNNLNSSNVFIAAIGKINTQHFPIGNWLFYYSNGKIKESGSYGPMLDTNIFNSWDENFNNAQLRKVGLWTSYYPNGNKRSEGYFKNDYRIGHWTNWYENGKLRSEAEYDVFTVKISDTSFSSSRNINGYKEYYESGIMKYHFLYNNKGLPVEVWSAWDSTGALNSKRFFNKQNIEDSMITYYSNGNVHNICYFKKSPSKKRKYRFSPYANKKSYYSNGAFFRWQFKDDTKTSQGIEVPIAEYYNKCDSCEWYEVPCLVYDDIIWKQDKFSMWENSGGWMPTDYIGYLLYNFSQENIF